jgi:predicted O-linked N-acetylglucosamine transferase (SPINDLY family)
MAGSLLQAVGLQTLVTYSWEAYEEKAVSLAGRTNELSQVKARLADARESARLFDSGHFCRNLEHAYSKMWQRHERGDPPESFQV